MLSKIIFIPFFKKLSFLAFWHLSLVPANSNISVLVIMSENLLLFFWVNCSYEWRRQWHPTPVLLPGKSHGRRSLVGCSPWGRKESDTTERLHFHFSLSCIGKWNGNPFQCSCLENPRDRGAWWAAVYGVTQSRTGLKRLSSSSSSSYESFLVTIYNQHTNVFCYIVQHFKYI